MPIAIAQERVDVAEGRRGLGVASDISAPGMSLQVDWTPVEGATDVEIDSATLTLDVALADETFPDVPVSSEGAHKTIRVPEGRDVKAIGLDVTLNPGERLTLSLPSIRGGWDAPVFASTGVSNGAMVPQSPQGAALANGLFSLPHTVTATRLRLSKVTGDKVTEFSPVAFDISKVNLATATAPRNLQVAGPDGSPVWQAPSLPAGSPRVAVDLRTPLEIALKKRLAAHQTPTATVTVSADAPSRAFVRMGAVQGALLRAVTTTITVPVDGAPAAMGLIAPLPDEVPTTVVADVSISYQGMRVLESVSDRLAATSGAVEGVIVGPGKPLRLFPVDAMNGVVPARIGILGRAPEDCEIAFEFVRVIGSSAGSALGPPAVLTLTRTTNVVLHWITVPGGIALQGPTGLQARANRGRFFWVTGAGSTPVCRVAILDPDPGGRPVLLGSTTLMTITATREEHPRLALPAAEFRRTAPVLSSDLFLVVDLSDLTLRYAR